MPLGVGQKGLMYHASHPYHSFAVVRVFLFQKYLEEIKMLEIIENTVPITEETQLPKWIITDARGNMKVNEIVFCKDFLKTRILKYINGQFRDIFGEVLEEEIEQEIFHILSTYFYEGIPYRLKNILKTLKFKCFSKPPEVCEDEIHLLNGVLKTNGIFYT